MTMTAERFESYSTFGLRLAAEVEARDDLHLKPRFLTKAAAGRLKAGLRALEAYIRRLLFAFALYLEPDLKPDQTWRPRQPRKAQSRYSRFRLIIPDRPLPDLLLYKPARDPWADRPLSDRGPVPAAPLLQRLQHVRKILNAPEAFARRLAFCLARRRPGLLAPPGFGRPGIPRRYGTEVSALYDALGHAILETSRARPPPLGPVPKPGPRITYF